MVNEKINKSFSSPVFLISAILALCTAALSVPLIKKAPDLLTTDYLCLFFALIFFVLFVSAKKGRAALKFMKVSYTVIFISLIAVTGLLVLIYGLVIILGFALSGLNFVWEFLSADNPNNPFPDDIFPEILVIILILVLIFAAQFYMAFGCALPIRKNATRLASLSENDDGEEAEKLLRKIGVHLIVMGALVCALNLYYIIDLIIMGSIPMGAELVPAIALCAVNIPALILPGIRLVINK